MFMRESSVRWFATWFTRGELEPEQYLPDYVSGPIARQAKSGAGRRA